MDSAIKAIVETLNEKDKRIKELEEENAGNVLQMHKDGERIKQLEKQLAESEERSAKQLVARVAEWQSNDEAVQAERERILDWIDALKDEYCEAKFDLLIERIKDGE